MNGKVDACQGGNCPQGKYDLLYVEIKPSSLWLVFLSKPKRKQPAAYHDCRKGMNLSQSKAYKEPMPGFERRPWNPP